MQSPAVVPTRGLQSMLACNKAMCNAGVPTRRGAIYASLPDEAGRCRRANLARQEGGGHCLLVREQERGTTCSHSDG